jgi:hypothetical protein
MAMSSALAESETKQMGRRLLRFRISGLESRRLLGPFWPRHALALVSPVTESATTRYR